MTAATRATQASSEKPVHGTNRGQLQSSGGKGTRREGEGENQLMRSKSLQPAGLDWSLVFVALVAIAPGVALAQRGLSEAPPNSHAKRYARDGSAIEVTGMQASHAWPSRFQRTLTSITPGTTGSAMRVIGGRGEVVTCRKGSGDRWGAHVPLVKPWESSEATSVYEERRRRLYGGAPTRSPCVLRKKRFATGISRFSPGI